ncbi:MAG: CinA family protein [Planctomycetaceae bacterium]|nr:CinA family protein [Planctomycetaceae bacterium]
MIYPAEHQTELDLAAQQLGTLLLETGQKIVFAESCTCGLLAAKLGEIPGISAVLCGSAVTYQNETKHAWLNIDNGILIDPGPVSHETAELMLQGVLRSTPHADVAVGVTGFLGPDSASLLDGQVYYGILFRREFSSPRIEAVRLPTSYPENYAGEKSLRLQRRYDVSVRIFQLAYAELKRESER